MRFLNVSFRRIPLSLASPNILGGINERNSIFFTLSRAAGRGETDLRCGVVIRLSAFNKAGVYRGEGFVTGRRAGCLRAEGSCATGVVPSDRRQKRYEQRRNPIRQPTAAASCASGMFFLCYLLRLHIEQPFSLSIITDL